jgi:hypothetical protein
MHAAGQVAGPDMQYGVNSAWYHLPSPPQIMTLLTPALAPGALHRRPGVQGAIAFFFMCLASDGAEEIANAVTATAVTRRILDRDFIWGPPRYVEHKPRIAWFQRTDKIKLAHSHHG